MRRLLVCLGLCGLVFLCSGVFARAGEGGPVSAMEIERFMTTYPAYCRFIAGTAATPEEDHSAGISAEIARLGWQEDRFFHVLSAVTARIAEKAGFEGLSDVRSQMQADRAELAGSVGFLPEGEKAGLIAEIDRELSAVMADDGFSSGLSEAEKAVIDARLPDLEAMMGESGMDEDLPSAYGFEPPLE